MLKLVFDTFIANYLSAIGLLKSQLNALMLTHYTLFYNIYPHQKISDCTNMKSYTE